MDGIRMDDASAQPASSSQAVPTTIRASWTSILRVGLSDLAHSPANTIPGLDALRTLAIWMVISDHYWYFFTRDTPSSLTIGKLPLFYFGWAGVDLFFVLSGYLIGRALWRELQKTGSLHIPRFLIRRGLRIWPYYYAFILFLIFTRSSTAISKFFPDIFFYSNYVISQVPGGWSLSSEEQFYVLTPILMVLGVLAVPFSRLWLIPAIALFALPLSRAAVMAKLGPHAHEGMASDVIYTPFHTHADGLVAGLLLAWLAVALPQFVKRRALLPNSLLPICLAVAGVALRQLNRDLFSFTGLALIFGGCVLFAIRDQSRIRRVTGSHIFYLISKLSYAMYLNHLIVMYGVMPRVLPMLGLGGRGYGSFVAGYLIAAGLSVGVAFLTFLCIESPFLQVRDRLLASRALGDHHLQPRSD
jgi:peptidoglycan/LPS O-acetylase OafA/YrhL